MAQPPGFFAGAALQFRIAEVGFGPLLGGDHIVFIHRETGGGGEGQEGLQIQGIGGIVQAPLQIRILAGMGQKSIELVQAHGCDGQQTPV